MAFENENNRVSFSGDGLTTVFPFPYYFQVDEDLLVIEVDDVTRVETVKTLSTHYTISGDQTNGVYDEGADIEMLVAPADGKTLVIYAAPEIGQPLGLTENAAEPAESLEQGYDRLAMLIRRLGELVGRSPRLPDGFTDSFDMRLPGEITPGSVIGINEDGDGLDLLSPDDLVNIAGALAIANNLSDLDDVDEALVNLGAGAGGDVLTETSTATVTNKSMSGSSNTFTNVPLGTAVTGTLPKANGGFGADVSGATFPTSGAYLTDGSSNTVTNKSMSGSSNTFTNIPLSAHTNIGTTTTVLHGNASGSPTFGPIALTTDVSGVLPIANGGTNNGSLGATNGGVPYADGSKLVLLAPGTDGQVLKLSSGLPSWAASGGAGGLIGDRELISNTDIEVNATGYTAYADAAGATPVDGTGGSPNSTIARNTSSPITGTADLIWTKSANNRQGEGFSIPFTVGTADQAKVLQIDFDYIVGSGTFVAGSSSVDSDLEVYLYDVTNSVLIQPSTYKLYSNSSTISDHFRANFQTSATGTSYRLCVHTATTSASAYTVRFDNLSIHPSKYTYGTPITDWVNSGATTITGTSSNPTKGSINTDKFLQRRVGSDMEFQITLSASSTGAASGSGDYLLLVPGGQSIDTTKVTVNATVYGASNMANATIFGAGRLASNQDTAIVYAADATHIKIYQPGIGVWSSNSNGISAGIEMQVFGSVPIVGWSSSVQMSSVDDARLVSTSIYKATNQTGVNPNSSLVKLTLDTALFDKTGAFSSGNSRVVIQTAGLYQIDAQAAIDATNVLNTLYYLSIWKNGSEIAYGSYRTVPASTNQTLTATPTLELRAGDYIEMALYGSGNNSSNTLTAIAGGTRLIVTKVGSSQTIAATETVAFNVYKAADQTGINTNGSNVQILPDTIVLDTHNRFASNTYTIQYPGVYTIGGYAELKTTNVLADQYLLKIYKNGSFLAPLGGQRAATTAINIDMSGSYTGRFIAGETITFFIYGNGNNSSSTVSLNGGLPSGNNGMYFWGTRIGL